MKLRRVALCVVVVVAGCTLAVFLCAQAAVGAMRQRIVDVADAAQVQVVIVPGASVLRSGEPSDVLKDRLATAFALYEAGKVKKVLLSGDHGRDGYDEVNAMRSYMQKLGVPAADIFLDHAGFDTYDTMHRARSVFGVTTAIVASQTYHLPRALYIGTHLGIDVYGVAAEQRVYAKGDEFVFRERFANVKAYLDVLRGAQPAFLGEPYDITADGTVTWDTPAE